MDRQNQRKITKNLVTVKKALRRDIEGITERLTEEGIFSKQTGEEIGTTDPLMKSGVFISKLLRSDTRAYWCFRDVLEELGYQKLVLSMEKSGTAGESAYIITILVIIIINCSNNNNNNNNNNNYYYYY